MKMRFRLDKLGYNFKVLCPIIRTNVWRRMCCYKWRNMNSKNRNIVNP